MPKCTSIIPHLDNTEKLTLRLGLRNRSTGKNGKLHKYILIDFAPATGKLAVFQAKTASNRVLVVHSNQFFYIEPIDIVDQAVQDSILWVGCWLYQCGTIGV